MHDGETWIDDDDEMLEGSGSLLLKPGDYRLPARKGLTVFYNEAAKDGEVILVAVKLPMYEQMKDNLEELLHSKDFDADAIMPSICIVAEDHDSFLEDMEFMLEDDCGFGEKKANEIVAQIDRETLRRLYYECNDKIVDDVSSPKEAYNDLRNQINCLMTMKGKNY